MLLACLEEVGQNLWQANLLRRRRGGLDDSISALISQKVLKKSIGLTLPPFIALTPHSLASLSPPSMEPCWLAMEISCLQLSSLLCRNFYLIEELSSGSTAQLDKPAETLGTEKRQDRIHTAALLNHHIKFLRWWLLRLVVRCIFSRSQIECGKFV